jgi:glutamine ABC superfamily ATP binding cassette transporter, membrane protein
MFLAGAIYLLMIGVVTILAKKLEKKFSYYR